MEGFGVLLFIGVLASYTTAKTLNAYEEHIIDGDPSYRLPKTLIPTIYNVFLKIDPEISEYDGNILLYFDVAETASTVTEVYLHADLDFLDITGILLNDDIACNIGSKNEVNILLIDCPTDITGQDNVLHITFTGKFSTEDEFGLVKTSYFEEETERILMESNFKPIYARRAFPCMDEPDFKANFSLEITYPEEYTVTSNTPVKAETSEMGIKTTQFEATPKISTHLFSILVSKLTEASSIAGDGYTVKVLAMPEVASMTSTIAGTYFSQIIEKLSNYTGSYNNLHDSESYQVVLPNYYTNAMGGFGLFTYSESELLDEADKTSARVKQNIIANMVYKLSHEWYGGEVSTKWWSDIWANEAVALYLKYIIADQIDGELELSNQFMVEVIQKALQHDALPLAEPLSSKESDVNLSRDIENKLDIYSHIKGASILHMTKYIVRGEENLQSALQYHFQQRQGLFTDGEDMLRDLVAAQDLDDYYPFLETWAFSPGFPLVSVTIGATLGDRTEFILLSQKRFVYPIDESSDYDNDKWAIPLTATNEKVKIFDKSMDAFFKPDQGAVYIAESNIWLMFNLQGGSFYRVNYDNQLWRRFINYLKSDERTGIEVLSRSKLIDDIFNIARIGDVSYALAFELAEYLVDEIEYYPWYSALNAFSYIRGKLEDVGLEAKFKDYVLDLIENEVNTGILSMADNLSHIDILKTVMILNYACELEHTACVTYATDKFKTFKEIQASLEDYNYRGLIFCNGIRYSENIEEDWTFLWNVFRNSPSVHEKLDILQGLGCTENKDFLISYLQKIINDDSEINKHDAPVVFKSIFSSSVGLDAAMDFLEFNFTRIASFYKGIDILSEVLYTVSEQLFTDEHLEWIKDVISNTVLDDYEDVRSKVIVQVSVNNYWRNNFQSKVKDVFIPPAPTTTTTTAATTTAQGTTATPSTTTESSCEIIYMSKFIGILVVFILTIL